jgi:hypothetical protein
LFKLDTRHFKLNETGWECHVDFCGLSILHNLCLLMASTELIPRIPYDVL